MARKIQSFIDIMDMLAEKDICMRIDKNGFQCYAFDLDIGSWWLAIYIRYDDQVAFKLFDEKLKARNLTWKGMGVQDKNTMVLKFKGLTIPIKVV